MHTPKHDLNLKVAIVGAGASGLTAAHTLKKLGYRHVVVYEAETRVGGKVHTFHHAGYPFELGAIWQVSEYNTVLGLLRNLVLRSNPTVGRSSFGMKPARNVEQRKQRSQSMDFQTCLSRLHAINSSAKQSSAP